ncbi:universal stress protein [Sulfitobacter mediterraneus]|jgi:nucleotide-binding universal stress UspA family protein|uniref:Nucleotide-binding universal stress UspA family protein n=1 Tax=Sulfitobacter mediterraneus TaxID=83219 RepID=A0A2T6CAG0_9RHOB|nr:universal stress protein [Sulfitobacter mediterraneus]KIN78293.1 UspA protein [Sulfitobacter mediterraneus KCTC 32188]PTX72180.1 nucleotide-binding universal stress UspA family protein [Sulfitobacter mediterraneus]
MYSKILVPMALDHGISPQTLEIARALCAPSGQISALHVYEVPKGSVSTYIGEDTVRQGYERALEIMKEKLVGLDDIHAEITRGQAHRAIIDHAVTHNFDCIVIGSHKPGLTDYLIGSTAARVVRHAPCAVHVHRDT